MPFIITDTLLIITDLGNGVAVLSLRIKDTERTGVYPLSDVAVFASAAISVAIWTHKATVNDFVASSVSESKAVLIRILYLEEKLF